jgi:hypothetical protein
MNRSTHAEEMPVATRKGESPTKVRTDGGQTESEGANSSNRQQPTDEFTEQLPDEVFDRLLSYQRDDETVEETLERVFTVLVPHATRLDRQANVAGENLDTDTRLIHQRWPDEDNYVDSYLYETVNEFVRAYGADWEVSD